jgi:hypothetical protein
VAGSQPFTDCTDPDEPRCGKDLEQREAARLMSYLDLYVLGAWRRRQLAIYVINDPCCFHGRGYETWRETVQAALARIGGGSYFAIGDETQNDHTVSPWAQEQILADLALAN